MADLRRARTLALLVVAATGCGIETNDRSPGAPEPSAPEWEYAVYDVTALPESQACGSTAFTFGVDAVIMVITSGGAGVTAAWIDGGFGEELAGAFSETEFAISWTQESTAALSCPSTGAEQIVTTFSNTWTGTFTLSPAILDSQLAQDVSDDCGIVSGCTLVWEIDGVAP